jgi:hypothetical protein
LKNLCGVVDVDLSIFLMVLLSAHLSLEAILADPFRLSIQLLGIVRHGSHGNLQDNLIKK